MKNILKVLLSWPALLIWAGALTFIAWPWADHMVSIFWIIITVAVLIGELLSYLRTKKTVSTNVQEKGKTDSIRFWIHLTAWIAFALTLAGHFMLKVI
jgi:hypothetical protein